MDAVLLSYPDPASFAKQFLHSSGLIVPMTKTTGSIVPEIKTKAKNIYVCFGGTGEKDPKTLERIHSNYKKMIKPSSFIINCGTAMGHSVELDDVVGRQQNVVAFGCTSTEVMKQKIPFPRHNACNFVFDGANISWGFESMFFFVILDGLLKTNKTKVNVQYSFANGGMVTSKEFILSFLIQPILQQRHHYLPTIVLQRNTGRFTDKVVEFLDINQQFVMKFGKYTFMMSHLKQRKNRYLMKCVKYLGEDENIVEINDECVYGQDHVIVGNFPKDGVVLPVVMV